MPDLNEAAQAHAKELNKSINVIAKYLLIGLGLIATAIVIKKK